ncbi:MAG: lipid A deacylase LpxR family protein [Cyclobacteriaceae bacterium]|nr:lipid A deacylase LpxR family protein [Cyclobacteriaceae bacterium]
MKKVYRTNRKKFQAHIIGWTVTKAALLLTIQSTGQGSWTLTAGQLLAGAVLTSLGEGIALALVQSLIYPWVRRQSFLSALTIKTLVNVIVLGLVNIMGLFFLDSLLTEGLSLLSFQVVSMNPILTLSALVIMTTILHIGQRLNEVVSCAKCDWTSSHPALFTSPRANVSNQAEQKQQTTSHNLPALVNLVSRNTGVSLFTLLTSVASKGIMSLLLLFSLEATAQETHGAIRITEENDWFTGTDRYYSNGVRVDFLFEGTRWLPGDQLLFAPAGYETKVRGLGLVQAMYTPANTSTQEAIRSDRPYAGTLYLNSFLETFHESTKLKVRSEISVGTLGPRSGAKETQSWFHSVINDDIPQGWDHQVRTTLLLNYGFRIEKGIAASHRAEAVGIVGFNIGTTQSDASIGAVLRFGILDRYFRSPLSQIGGTKAYLFVKPTFTAVITNETLEGTTANMEQDASAVVMNNGIFRYEYGFSIRHGRTTVTYSVVNTSPEFSGAAAHRYGSASVNFQLF